MKKQPVIVLGRIKRQKAGVKSKTFLCRVTPAQKELLEERARVSGMDVCELVRSILFGQAKPISMQAQNDILT